MHLSPKMYHIVQCLVHGNYEKTLKILSKMLDIENGDIIVELGSGDGGFSRNILQMGCQYYGIDADEERVKIAQQNIPKASFFASDLIDFDFSTIPITKQYFCHGLLHHLDDEQCKKLIKKIIGIDDNVRFVTIEPVRPITWYSNPIGTIVSNMDDGDYIRTIDSWKELFNPWLSKLEILNLFPRWPIPFVFCLLESKQKFV